MRTVAPGVVVGVSRTGRRTVATEGRIRADDASPFRIASLTKPLTAVAVVRALAHRGISLTTPAIELLPTLTADWRADRAVTVEQLLAQVSGLRETVDGAATAALGDGPEALESIARLVIRAGNDHTPGDRWPYYNGNYFLAGSILSAVTGVGYEDALHRTLLAPWGLTRTGFDTPDAAVPGWDGDRPLSPRPYPRGRRPSGGLWSCVADYLSFGERLLADAALLAEVGRPRTGSDDPTAYGLGWALGPSGQMYLNGRLPGYRTAALLLPEHRCVAVAFGNSSQALPAIARHLGALQRDFTGDDPAADIDGFAA